MVADPGHRQIGEHRVVGGEFVERVGVLGRQHDVVVRQHHAFGPAGRAGRIQHHADIGALALGDLVEPPARGAGVAAHLLPPELLHVLERVQPGRIVGAQAALFLEDDGAQLREPVGDRDELVDLLLVLHDREFRLGVVEHVGHFVGDRVLVGRHGNAADALHGRKRGVEPRAVVADDGHDVAALEAQLAQADGERAHLVAHLRPGPRLPDAEILVAHRRPVGVLGGVAQQQLRYRVQGLCRGGHGADSLRTYGAHRRITSLFQSHAAFEGSLDCGRGMPHFSSNTTSAWWPAPAAMV